MSLRTNRIYLLFVSLITLVSCEKPNDIGLNLPGQNQLGTYYTKQSADAATVVHPDSILAFNNNPIVVGKVTDGDFGTIAATHYTEIGLNGTNVTFDVTQGTQADSLVLVLAYSGYYYGDTTATIKLNVNKLSQNFEDDKTYFIKSKLTTESQPLGSITFKPRYNRVKNASRLIRIPLNKAFATQLLAKSGTSDFATQETFKAFWKGIAITPDASSASGSLVGFTSIPDTSGTALGKVGGINLYYKDKNGNAQFHNFALGGTYFNGLEASQQGQFTGNVAYIQENTGIQTLVTFPNLENFKADKGNIYINHAELILPAKSGTINVGGKVTQAPDAIFLYESTPGKRILKTSGGVSFAVQRGDASAYGITRPNVAVYNKDSTFYKADITSYVQAILDQKKNNNGILISAKAEDSFTAQAAGVSYPGNATAKRVILDTDKNKLILRIYYSKLN